MKALIFFLSLLILIADADNEARKANQAFEEGRFEEAVELYNQAIAEDPDNPRLYFNRASALYKLGRSEEATQSYERFAQMVEDPEEQALADYNRGTMLTDQQEFEKAAELFREALMKNPDDDDARHNYELALRRQQQQEQQQQQQQQSDQEEQSDNQQQNRQQQQDGESQQDQNQQQQPRDQPQNPEDQGEQQPRPTEMTPEEAENILDALAQLERKLLEDMKKESDQNQSENEKDW